MNLYNKAFILLAFLQYFKEQRIRLSGILNVLTFQMHPIYEKPTEGNKYFF